MSKVIEMRDAIGTFLETKHSEVYYETASDKVDFPYVVYDLPNAFSADESTETFVLEVDVWDAPENGDTIPLETLIDEIDKGLHQEVIRTNGMAFVFYREKRLSLPDDNKKIRRRKIIYQVRTFGG